MILHCALVHGAEAWKQVLIQCGVPLSEGHGAVFDPVRASVLAVDGRLSREDAEGLRDVLARGGAVIGAAADIAPAIGMPTRKSHVRYLVDERRDRWCDLLDLDGQCVIPREANVLRTDQGDAAIFAGEVGGGWAVLLPFDFQKVWEGFAKRYRQFPSHADRQPFELVSSVSRADLTFLIGKALEFLHHRRGLPYARLWPFPGEAPGVFAVRLDSDKASRGDIEDFIRCSRESGAPFTWFVDTGSHGTYLDVFRGLQDQEIGIHCHRHVVYRSVDDFRTDIRLARAHLAKEGIQPKGYAAPFGEWTAELGEAIDDSQLAYSSEFTLGYDGFPFSYRSKTKRYATPQIPVHPISTGALRRAGYPPKRMVAYYASVIRRKMARQEPVFLLDHPVHRNHRVIAEVVTEAVRRGAIPVRFLDYLRWWQRREDALKGISLTWDGKRVCSSTRESDLVDPPVRLRVTTPTGGSFLSIGGESEPGNDGKYPTDDDSFSIEDARRSREFDLRTAFGVTATLFLRRLRQ